MGYPSDWNRRRKEVYERDDFKCQNCGILGGIYGDAELHAHHGVPLNKGGSNNLSNLITYCKDCHDSIHHKGKTAPKDAKTINKAHSQNLKGLSESEIDKKKSESYEYVINRSQELKDKSRKRGNLKSGVESHLLLFLLVLLSLGFLALLL